MNIEPGQLEVGRRYIIASVDPGSDWHPIRQRIIGLTVEIVEHSFSGAYWKLVDWPFTPSQDGNYSQKTDSYCMYGGTYTPALDIDPAIFAAWCQRDQEDSDE